MIGIIYFTERGRILAENLIKDAFANESVNCKSGRTKQQNECVNESDSTKQSNDDWIRERFANRDKIIFIGAMGIAVRMIAPYVKDKLTDSPVVVLDDQGQFVIPVLSGHVGGANDLARHIAKSINATPVITTATDNANAFAVDLFAKENNLAIVNKDGIAKVSSKVLDGEKINIEVVPDILITDKLSKIDANLILATKGYVAGMGCKQGKTKQELRDFLNKVCDEEEIYISQIEALCSIDVKAKEQGLIELSRELGIEFVTFSAEELNSVEGDFEESEFVRTQVGTGNVCERSVARYIGEKLEYLSKKRSFDGMTCAIGKRR